MYEFSLIKFVRTGHTAVMRRETGTGIVQIMSDHGDWQTVIRIKDAFTAQNITQPWIMASGNDWY